MGTTSLLCLALLCSSSMAFTTCVAAGLRLELTHVDANRTVEERMRRAMARTRQHRLASTDAVAAPIHWMKTQYIAEYVIGDPPQRAEAIIDTGSNLSHLFVGGLSPSSNAPVTSVPFLQNPNEDPYSTFYYLPLTGIAVGDTTLDVPASAFALRQDSSGQWVGTIIDSGSPFTALVDVAYQALRDELARQLSGSLVQPPEDGLDLCVARGKVVPPLVLHLGMSGGGDLMVPSENYWGPVDDATCMMVFRSPSESTTIGNYMQQNMHLLYDLGNNVLSFQTADCSSM
ncbi:unnamed protein product [Urochloa decumbens]|uniref:Peptidase A1 domain-containing protein n=1 Tax=Urochloa decumbens TaxID=240449 RepID=A0ABC8VX81_9POAL